MASILPGYNYDIFISYRHKDNKYDGWVTEFVQNLKKELEATFKEDISIYFDFNPDDGLLETHNVDKSLEGKLNCLIFIPILSQTYCDPKSFAWEHEFRAFNKAAKEDAFGRDIKLRSGNVASRILPIRVRELDEEDKQMLEAELGGVLRPVDFIYKEQGVNRPLKPEDSESTNLNRTKYRNQINKTAGAIKEIMTALKFKHSGAPEPVAVPQVFEEAAATAASETPRAVIPPREKRSKMRRYFWIAFGVAVASYFVFVDKDSHDNDDDDSSTTEQSIAVLPFDDLSEKKDQEYFSDGISEEILNSLAQIEGLKVAGRTSSFQFKGQKIDLKEVGRKLNVKSVLEGSVRKIGNKVKITAQLINVKDGYHVYSETFTREMTDIFAIQDEVANKIAKVLLKELAVHSVKTDRGTDNAKAFEYYLEGKHINLHEYVQFAKPEDFARAEGLLKKAIELDPNYALAHAGLADLYNTYTNRVNRKDTMYLRLQQKEVDIAMKLNPESDYVRNTLGQVQMTKQDYDGAYENFIAAFKINPKDANNLVALGAFTNRVGLIEELLTITERQIELEPLENNAKLVRGSALFQLGRYDEAIAQLKDVVQREPDNYGALFQLSYLGIIKKDKEMAKKYLDRCKEVNSRATEFGGLAAAFEAAFGDKAKALTLRPDFRTYFILGMKKEAKESLMKSFLNAKPPVNAYLSLTKTPILELMGDDPEIKDFMKRQEETYKANKARYKLPPLK